MAVRCPWPTQAPCLQQHLAPACGAPMEYTLLAVFDGHNGPEAACLAEACLVPTVEALLPPLQAQQAQRAAAEPAELAAAVQEALVRAFLGLQRQLASAGCPGGCAATVALLVRPSRLLARPSRALSAAQPEANTRLHPRRLLRCSRRLPPPPLPLTTPPLQVGRLVTVASVGSARCVLHTAAGGEPLVLSEEHRVATNVQERQRLLRSGCTVAAVDAGGSGPAPHPCRGTGVLRLWPGGLTLSRSLGDFKIGEAVLPLPHIKQVGGGAYVPYMARAMRSLCRALSCSAQAS